MKQTSVLRTIVGGFVLYLFTTVVSFGFFAAVRQQAVLPTTEQPLPLKSGQRPSIDPSLPKTEECPINGALHSQPERIWWTSHRPLGIMIENHLEARPQSGLSSADVVYEAVAEGGITRFLAIFYCQDADIVGPVRSARTYFLDFISEYGEKPLYAHVGGANTAGPADALGQIADYGWVGENDLNQFSLGYPTFWRDYERLGHQVATEHTMYSTTTKLWLAAAKRNLTQIDDEETLWNENFRPWLFREDISEDKRPTNASISFNFWSGHNDYAVRWDYDSASNIYLRFNGGQPQLDLNNQEQLRAKNIVLVFMDESPANDGYPDNIHLLYGTIGDGAAVIINDGRKLEGVWQKESRTKRMIFKDKLKQEIKFVRGPMWIEILPIGTKVDYQ